MAEPLEIRKVCARGTEEFRAITMSSIRGMGVKPAIGIASIKAMAGPPVIRIA
jgi:hypothetical protein